jgi:uncharacterized repeat protein (TIGR01451 family)
VAFFGALALLVAGSARAAQGIDLDQCANGTLASPVTCLSSPTGWQNGDLNSQNSHLREGDSVPFRVILTGLEGTSHTLVIQYDTLASGKHAYDYLTRWNRTTGGDPCSGVTGCSGAPSGTATIPLDPLVGAGGFQGTPLPDSERYFAIWNGSITGVSLGGGSDAAGQQSMTISFTSTSDTVVIAWGGHVGAQLNWGLGNSAGAINGSPYHMRVLDLDGSGGNQDRSMKASAVAPTPPNFETDASSGSVALGGSVTDTATLSGANGAVTGSVQFFVCGPNLASNPDCSTPGSGSSLGTSTVGVNGQATSPAFSPQMPGNYCVRAEYTPDGFAAYSPAVHTNTTTETSDPAVHGECFAVAAAAATVTTTVHNAAHATITSAPIGSTVHDRAVVSGNFGTPTGNVTFTLYPSTDCSGTGTTSGAVALSGGAAESGTTTVPVGGLSYRAHYLGGGNYEAADGECEPLQATQLTPSVVTTIRNASGDAVTSAPIGTVVHDTVVVSGGAGTPTGSVTFRRFTTTDCTGGHVDETVSLSGGTAASSTTSTPSGGLSYQAVYAGDATYTAKTGDCEPLVATKLTPTVVTTIRNSSGDAILAAPIGTVVHDTVVVGGSLTTPTGNVTFRLYSTGDCTGDHTDQTVALSSGTAASGTTTVPAGGLSYEAVYAGDGTYTAKTGDCEPLSADKLTPTVVTTIRNADGDPVLSAPIGSSVHDTVVVGGSLGDPTGNVTFRLYSTTDCTGAHTDETVALSGGTGASGTTTVPVGGLSYEAVYAGDGTYTARTGDCEPLSAEKLTPSAVTTIRNADGDAVTSVPIGTVVHDTVAVSGGAGTPTGSVTFRRYLTTDCSGEHVDETVSLSGGNAASSTTGAPAGGMSYEAVYAGDATYTAVTAECEPLETTKLTPTVVTTIRYGEGNALLSAPIGSSVHDTVVVGGSLTTPGGTVTFRLYSTTDCTGAHTDETVALLNGEASTGTATVPASGLSYEAVYAGDGTYTAKSGDCEPLTPGKLTPSVVTTIRNADGDAVLSAPIGSSVHDTVVVGGSFGDPTGDVTFRLYSTTDCTGDHTDETVTLAGGTAASGTTTVPVGGLSYEAVYAGDDTYTAGTGECEPLQATKLAATVATDVHNAAHEAVTSVLAGSTVHDRALVSGTEAGGAPTGSVTFTLFGNVSCSGEGTTGDPVELSGGSAESAATKAAAPGMSYRAHYAGCATYERADGACEPLAVTSPPTPTPAPQIDLAITKADDPDPVSTGGTLTYTIVATNNGPAVAHGVVVSDSLPATVTFVSAASTQGTCSGAAVVTCGIGTLAPGASATITIVVTPTVTGTIVNTAVVVGNETETTTANNTATAMTLVEGLTPPSPCYALTVNPRLLHVGHRSLVTATVRSGGRAARGVKVRLRGAGISRAGTTNGRGTVRFSLKPTRPGMVRAQITNRRACNARLIPAVRAVVAFTG